MKTNKKALELVETGLTSKAVSRLTESQIEELHSKLFSEQAGVRQETKPVQITTISQDALQKGVNVGGKNMKKDSSGNVVVTTEEMTEEDDEDSKNNAYAICRAQVGSKKTRKFGRCLQSVKKSLKEGKNPVSLFIENKIMEIVETHLPPKITKKDLVKYLSEAEPATAPTKDPKTKPGTKQPPSPVKTPSHPGKNPNPGVKEAPKAKNIDAEEAKEKIIDTIMKILQK